MVFDAQRVLGSAVPAVIVEYIVPHVRDRCVLGHSEGSGFLWLGLLHVSAYCLTMADALSAIDALVPYVPLVVSHHQGYWDWMALRGHLRWCIALEGDGDPVRVAAIRRMLRED